MKFENVKKLACYLIDNEGKWFRRGDNGSCAYIGRRFRYRGSDDIIVGLSLDMCIGEEITPIKKSIGKNSFGDEFFEGDRGWFVKYHNSYIVDRIHVCDSDIKAGLHASESYKTKEQAEEMLKRYIVEEAFKNGKKLEFRGVDKNRWRNCYDPAWDWNAGEYRVKNQAEIIAHNDGTVTVNGMHLSVNDNSVTILE
jgi:hypothetical protein